MEKNDDTGWWLSALSTTQDCPFSHVTLLLLYDPCYFVSLCWEFTVAKLNSNRTGCLYSTKHWRKFNRCYGFHLDFQQTTFRGMTWTQCALKVSPVPSVQNTKKTSEQQTWVTVCGTHITWLVSQKENWLPAVEARGNEPAEQDLFVIKVPQTWFRMHREWDLNDHLSRCHLKFHEFTFSKTISQGNVDITCTVHICHTVAHAGKNKIDKRTLAKLTHARLPVSRQADKNKEKQNKYWQQIHNNI